MKNWYPGLIPSILEEVASFGGNVEPEVLRFSGQLETFAEIGVAVWDSFAVRCPDPGRRGQPVRDFPVGVLPPGLRRFRLLPTVTVIDPQRFFCKWYKKVQESFLGCIPCSYGWTTLKA